MARNDQIRKPKKEVGTEPDPDLLAHVESLGLTAIDDYVAWCARHGFSRRTAKNWRQRLKDTSSGHLDIGRLAILSDALEEEGVGCRGLGEVEVDGSSLPCAVSGEI